MDSEQELVETIGKAAKRFWYLLEAERLHDEGGHGQELLVLARSMRDSGYYLVNSLVGE